MKPSDRIRELYKKNSKPYSGYDSEVLAFSAILDYLDEQHEKSLGPVETVVHID
jgi:hypothetical protein